MQTELFQYTHEPEISHASVKAALRALRYSPTPHRPNSLDKLLLVDTLLRAPGMPASSRKRTLALQHILVDLITTTYTDHRRHLGLPVSTADAGKALVMRHIADDLKTENVELIAWSWLYHLYVRIDLDLNLTGFWQIGAFEERTRRRYQRHALRRLAELLHDREWDARKLHRKRHLYLKLPLIAEPVLGRDDLLTELQRTVGAIFPVCVQVTGEEGIGKTAFVRELLRQQSKDETLDDLFWFDKPHSTAQIALELLHRFALPSLEAADGLAADYRIALVLDDIRDLENDLEALNTLLHALPHFMIYLTHRHPLFLAVPARHLPLKGIQLEYAQQVIHYLQMTHTGYDLSPAEIEMMWQETGSNPGRMKAELQAITQSEHDPA